MKKIMSQMVLTMGIAFGLFQGSPAQAIESRPVLVRTLTGAIVEVNSRELELVYLSLVDEDLSVLAFRQQAFTQISQFAYTSTGLNLDQNSAASFADRMSRAVRSSEDVGTLKEAGNYAYRSNGMNLDNKSAAEWVEKLMRLPRPKDRLAIHKAAFTHAYGSSGLNLPQEQALKIANDQSGIPN